MPTLRYKVSKASANVKNESTKGRKPKKVAVVRKEPGSIGLSWAVDKDKSGKGKVDGGNVVDSNGEAIVEDEKMGIGAGPGLSAVADGEDDEIIAIKKDPFVQLGMAAEDFCQRRTIHDGAVRVTVLAGNSEKPARLAVGDSVILTKKVVVDNSLDTTAIIVAECFDMDDEVYEEVGVCMDTSGGNAALMRLLPAHMVCGEVVEVEESGVCVVEWEASRRCGPFL